jgi:hypothetical protein
VAQLQLLGAGFRPVFPARRAGLQSGTQLWLRRRTCDTPYGLGGRTARLVGVHRCTSCIDDSAVRSLGRDQRRTSRTRQCGPRGAALLRVSRVVDVR